MKRARFTKVYLILFFFSALIYLNECGGGGPGSKNQSEGSSKESVSQTEKNFTGERVGTEEREKSDSFEGSAEKSDAGEGESPSERPDEIRPEKRAEESAAADEPAVSEKPADEVTPEPVAEIDSPPENIPPEGKRPTAAFKIDKLIISQDPKKGLDLDGDGKVDNQMGKILSDPVVKNFLKQSGSDIQKTIDDQIAKEQLILLIELRDMTDPKGQSGTATVNFYMGQKTAQPGVYKISPSSLDPSGKPLITFPKTPINNGVVKTKPKDITIVMSLIPGQLPTAIELKKARLHFKISPGLTALSDGKLAGALPPKNLDVNLGLGSVLGLLLQFIPHLVQPDIDNDGDGLEKLSYKNGQIQCTDGNGTNVPPPSTCPPPKTKCNCTDDPKIQDGYSLYMEFTAKQTTITK